ncbi:MAG: flavin reductase family protein [Acidimicrobiia bacterium]|jgi:flavin reductase (DIM6/NTAB) family NADH-FMN oxidoreductase RutF
MEATPDVETINKVMWHIPNPLCLLGSRAGDEWNGMTQSWVSQVAMDPVLVAVSVDAAAVTNRLIRQGGSFSVNLWDKDDTRVFVKFSKPASKDGDTLNGRPIREGKTGVPIFTEAVAYIECRVVETIELGSHDLFVGEVVDAGFNGEGETSPAAAMDDTRMKYGGVLRAGHKKG